MSSPGTISWFGAHEARLAWRDALWMLSGRRRWRRALLGGLAFVIFMHVLAYSAVARFAEQPDNPDRTTLAAITVTWLLALALMVSQALESTTRALYARADLDLILSSPTNASTLFAVRMAAIAGATTTLAAVIAAPFINVLAGVGGRRWLLAYTVVAATGLLAAALSITMAVGLFKTIGPRRTRTVAQVAAALIGAGFLIAVQAIAVLSFGTLSRYDFLGSETVVAWLPVDSSPLWAPARAVLGDPLAAAAMVIAGVIAVGAAIRAFAPGFAGYAAAAASVVIDRSPKTRAKPFMARSPSAALRRKEWLLLWRDPWLLSQTLMQILYLLPPALLLWVNYGAGEGAFVVLVPVLVMAAGQLAGGLAWLAISGEDAPDLVMTAPIGPGRILRAKIEAVLGAVGLVFLPLVLAAAPTSPASALAAAAGIAAAAAAATTIQLWFRTHASRSHFRRRQTASRVATFAEAFSSIGWAGTAALAASGTPLALLAGAAALLTLLVARAASPARI